MPERNTGFGGGSAAFSFKDTVCIDCNKIMDSCRDKDYQPLICKNYV